ncbi:hypothetical protein PENSPDRAFT_583503 [Peniophora sp. CONT]|nr:hypothetical protein PENSPDRAFT_583503 [Peniophora sp. CONT]
MLHRQCVDPITGKVVKYRPTSELTPAPVQPAPASITIDPTLISNQTIENPFYGVSYGSNGTPTTSGTGWTAEKRRQFAADMLRLLIAINAAYMSVEHPYWRHFFSVWVPGCTVPTRADVSGQVLDEEADRVTKIMKDEVEGHYGTGQSDGWKSEAKEALVGSMVNVEYKPWPLNLFPITGEKKTAMNLLNIVLSEISYCVNTLGIRLVAYCTDSGGDAAKMRKMLFAKFPYLIVIACWAHQVRIVCVNQYSQY